MATATNLISAQETSNSRRSSEVAVDPYLNNPCQISLTPVQIYNTDHAGLQTLKPELFAFSPQIDTEKHKRELAGFFHERGEVQLGIKERQIDDSLKPIFLKISELKLALKDTLAKQKVLIKSKNSLTLFFLCSARRELKKELAPLKETEIKLREMLLQANLEWLRRQTESEQMHKNRVNTRKMSQSASICAANKLINWQEESDLRSNNRYLILNALKTTKRLLEQKTQVEDQVALNSENCHTLALKARQAEAAQEVLTKERRILVSAKSKMLLQRQIVKNACPWYKIRPNVQKVELQQIRFVIQRIKNREEKLNQIERQHSKEIKRLNKRFDQLATILNRLDRLNAEPQETQNKPSFQKKVAKLNQEKTSLENDTRKKRLCF